PTLCGANHGIASRALAQRIKFAVQWQDERSVVGNPQFFGSDLNAQLRNFANFAVERPGIDHHSVADNRKLAANNSGREKRELVGLIVDDQRMTRVMSSLKAHNDVCTLGKPVDDLTFALVAPL